MTDKFDLSTLPRDASRTLEVATAKFGKLIRAPGGPLTDSRLEHALTSKSQHLAPDLATLCRPEMLFQIGAANPLNVIEEWAQTAGALIVVPVLRPPQGGEPRLHCVAARMRPYEEGGVGSGTRRATILNAWFASADMWSAAAPGLAAALGDDLRCEPDLDDRPSAERYALGSFSVPVANVAGRKIKDVPDQAWWMLHGLEQGIATQWTRADFSDGAGDAGLPHGQALGPAGEARFLQAVAYVYALLPPGAVRALPSIASGLAIGREHVLIGYAHEGKPADRKTAELPPWIQEIRQEAGDRPISDMAKKAGKAIKFKDLPDVPHTQIGHATNAAFDAYIRRELQLAVRFYCQPPRSWLSPVRWVLRRLLGSRAAQSSRNDTADGDASTIEAFIPLLSWSELEPNKDIEYPFFIDAIDPHVHFEIARLDFPEKNRSIVVIGADIDLEDMRLEPKDICLRLADDATGQFSELVHARHNQTVGVYFDGTTASRVARRLADTNDDTPRRLEIRFESWTDHPPAKGQKLVLTFKPQLYHLPDFDIEIPEASQEAIDVRYPHSMDRRSGDRIDLFTFTPKFTPVPRLFKHGSVSSRMTVTLEGLERQHAGAIGESLRLMADERDETVPLMRPKRTGERTWSFTDDVGSSSTVEFTQTVVDLADPAKGRLCVDAKDLRRALSMLPGAELTPGELAGAIRVDVMLGTGSLPEKVVSKIVALRLRYDLRPNFFLDLPGSNELIGLFKRSGEGRRRLPSTLKIRQQLPRSIGKGRQAPVAPDDSLSLTLQLRKFGGQGETDIEIGYRIDGLHQEPQSLDLARFTPGPDGDGSFAPISCTVPLDGLRLPGRRAHGRTHRLEILLRRRPATGTGVPSDDTDTIELDFGIETVRNGGILCIDWGTSAIAALYAGKSDLQTPTRLRLGEVSRESTGSKSRADIRRRWGSQMDDESKELIPSRVSLSPRQNPRAVYQPTTYLDLRSGGTGEENVKRRLIALRRRYDIGLPAPSGTPAPEDAPFIIGALKLLFAQNREIYQLTEPVISYRKGEGTEAEDFVRTRTVYVRDLVLDCFDELGSFYLAKSLEPNGRDPEDDELRLVLTHPCGLGRNLLQRYRSAGRQTLQRIDHSRLGTIEIGSEETPQADDEDEAVVLVPESLAAAYFVLRVLDSSHDRRLTERPARLIALDLGAGTFDVSIIDVGCEGNDPTKGWSIQCHYGVQLGGDDLDRLLGDLVHALLTELAKNTRHAAYSFPIVAPDEERNGEQMRRTAHGAFGNALECAKRELTAELFKRVTEKSGDYEWLPPDRRSQHASSVLRIKVGQMGSHEWPIVLTRNAPTGSLATLAEERVRLVSERMSEETQDAFLDISNIFDETARVWFEGFETIQRTLDALREMVELITDRLPKGSLAWLDRQGKQLPKNTALFCAVTGRAALWPPIFAGFVKLAASLKAEMLPARQGRSKPAPMDPQQMKQAVMLGAYHLTMNRDLLKVPIPAAPLAFRMVPLPDGTSQQIRWPGRIFYVDECVGNGTVGSLKPGRNELVQIARVVPGLDGLDPQGKGSGYLKHLDVELWFDLLPAAINPRDLTGSRRASSDLTDLTIEVVRDPNDLQSIRVVTFKADSGLRCPIEDAGSTFIGRRPHR